MKLAVLGAGGLLGRHVVEEAARAHDVVALARDACDVGDLPSVLEATRGCAAIVNCAAYTNVDGAESDEAGAYRGNAVGAENAARAARAHGAHLVHISTDFVFDGAQAAPYDEFAAPNPLGHYGRSKWAGEQLLARVGARAALVRVQGLYGAGGRNFSSRLVELLRARKPLKLDGERRVQPTWARVAARTVVALSTRAEEGVFHLSCGGETTWAGFARRVCERLALEPHFAEVSSAQLATPAARPPNCVFAHRMLALRGYGAPPSWQAALDEYLMEIGS